MNKRAGWGLKKIVCVCDSRMEGKWEMEREREREQTNVREAAQEANARCERKKNVENRR